jgi:hypothetical protein
LDYGAKLTNIKRKAGLKLKYLFQVIRIASASKKEGLELHV